MIYTTKTASITDLRQQATALIHQVQEDQSPLLILQNSKVSGVLVDPQTFEELIAAYQDQKDYELAVEALHQKKEKTFSLREIESMRKEI